MGRKYAIRDHSAIYSVTFTVVNWIDLFIRNSYREIIISNLKYCQKYKNLNIHAYCIMTSHMHLILSVNKGNVSSVIRDFKSYTSLQIKRLLTNQESIESRKTWLIWMFERSGKMNPKNNSFQLWQQNNHPIDLSTNIMIDQRLDYIHDNPVEAGFVSRPEDWVWSSARQYNGELGEIEITYL